MNKLTSLDFKTLDLSFASKVGSWGTKQQDTHGDDIPFARRVVDPTNCGRVLKKFYKWYFFNSKESYFLLQTNKGTMIQIIKDYVDDALCVNGNYCCLGDNNNSWASTIGYIKTTSEFLAQLAVFANKNAK